jgi:prepilin signal peptidase PulO-like enzyme (type II secretory pathway)
MLIAILITTFVFGLLMGSFLFNVAERLMASEPFIKGRSKCPKCKVELNAKNLIPLVSYTIQRGKCSGCHEKISFYYPLSELTMGLLAVLAIYLSGFYNSPALFTGVNFFYYLVIFAIFLIIFFTDLRYQLIPNSVLYAGIAVAIFFKLTVAAVWLYKTYTMLTSTAVGVYLAHGDYFRAQVNSEIHKLLWDLLAGIIIAVFFGLLVVLTRGRGMGRGDIWLGFMIGIFNGLPLGFIAVFIGFVLGSIVGLGLIVTKLRKSKDTIAFGPFLMIGSIAALVFGNQIFTWYISLR